MSNVTLSPFSDAGVEHFFALWSDRSTIQFTNWTFLASLDEVSARVSRIQQRYSESPERMGPFVIREGSGAFVGLIGVDFVDAEHELWYLLSRDKWGQGYGTSAVSEVLKLLDAARKPWRLVATSVAINVASWRLLEKNGFVRVKAIASGFQRNELVADLFKYELQLVLRV